MLLDRCHGFCRTIMELFIEFQISRCILEKDSGWSGIIKQEKQIIDEIEKLH